MARPYVDLQTNSYFSCNIFLKTPSVLVIISGSPTYFVIKIPVVNRKNTVFVERLNHLRLDEVFLEEISNLVVDNYLVLEFFNTMSFIFKY